MILLWGVEQDPPLMLVREALTKRRIPHLFLDHKRLWETELEVVFGDEPTGFIAVGGRRIALEEITAAYLRPYNHRLYPALVNAAAADQGRMQQRANTFDDILWAWAETTPARMLNRPGAMQSNNSKPYQTALIREAGFAVPDTILTNCPNYARSYLEQEKEVIYKSISSVRSIVSKLGVDKARELDNVRWCPTQFQRCVQGVDCRVHVVGERVFATRIVSEADDYRYSRTDRVVMPLRPKQERKFIGLSRALHLPLCGADFRVTPEGEWICFEVNPSPAYSYYEQGSGQPISAAIADYLIGC